MYTLTLSADDRRAFDFVGNRYSTGDAIRDILESCIPAQSEDWMQWDSNVPLTFEIPEHLAWRIMHLSDEENDDWPLFAPSLASKMQNFVDAIV